MPLLRLHFNGPLTLESRQTLAREGSRIVSEMLGKPESYVMVSVSAEETLLFGGSDAPACFMSLHSLGLPEDQTPRYSRMLCSLAEEHLGVPPARVYIAFASPPRHMWGYNNTTFG